MPLARELAVCQPANTYSDTHAYDTNSYARKDTKSELGLGKLLHASGRALNGDSDADSLRTNITASSPLSSCSSLSRNDTFKCTRPASMMTRPQSVLSLSPAMVPRPPSVLLPNEDEELTWLKGRGIGSAPSTSASAVNVPRLRMPGAAKHLPMRKAAVHTHVDTDAFGEHKAKGRDATTDMQCPKRDASLMAKVAEDTSLYSALRALRSAATSRRLLLSDALPEYAGAGRDASLGVMAKSRFRSALGILFKGTTLSAWLLDRVCGVYGTGNEDRTEPGTYQQVRWKAFAADFDQMPPPLASPGKPEPPAEVVEAMRAMSAYTSLHAIDLEADLAEVLGGVVKAYSDLCSRPKFTQALGVVLGSCALVPYRLSERLVDELCLHYAAGKMLRAQTTGPDHYEHVRWRDFAADVARLRPLLRPQPYLPLHAHSCYC